MELDTSDYRHYPKNNSLDVCYYDSSKYRWGGNSVLSIWKEGGVKKIGNGARMLNVQRLKDVHPGAVSYRDDCSGELYLVGAAVLISPTFAITSPKAIGDFNSSEQGKYYIVKGYELKWDPANPDSANVVMHKTDITEVADIIYQDSLLILKLKRAIPGTNPVKLSERKGNARVGDWLCSFGYGAGVPLKCCLGHGQTIVESTADSFRAPINTFTTCPGSPVFSEKMHLEGICLFGGPSWNQSGKMELVPNDSDGSHGPRFIDVTQCNFGFLSS